MGLTWLCQEGRDYDYLDFSALPSLNALCDDIMSLGNQDMPHYDNSNDSSDYYYYSWNNWDQFAFIIDGQLETHKSLENKQARMCSYQPKEDAASTEQLYGISYRFSLAF